MLVLDNTQVIRGMVKTPASQLVAKGYARPGLMQYRPAYPWVSVNTPGERLRDRGYLRGLADTSLDGLAASRRAVEELTDLDLPDEIYSTGTPLITRRNWLDGYPVEELTGTHVPTALYGPGNMTPTVTRATLAGLGDTSLDALGQGYGEGYPTDPSLPAGTSSDVSTVMTAVNAEIGYLVNLARAQQGKPPLPASATAPAVRVGLDTASLRPLLPLAAVAAGLWLLLGRRRR